VWNIRQDLNGLRSERVKADTSSQAAAHKLWLRPTAKREPIASPTKGVSQSSPDFLIGLDFGAGEP
jgi:hypothetical protein